MSWKDGSRLVKSLDVRQGEVGAGVWMSHEGEERE